MEQEQNVRLRLIAEMQGKNLVAEQLASLLILEKEIVEQNQKITEATKARAAAAEAAATREKGMLNSLIGIQNELAAAGQRQEEAAKRAAEAAKARAKAKQDEAAREKGLLEGLQAKYRDLEQARARALTMKEVKAYNQQLTQLQREIARADQGIRGMSQSTGGLTGQFRSLQQAATAAFSAAALYQFANQIKDVTSNAESYAISMQTMLQSNTAAFKLNAEVIDLAKRTPFTLGEVQEQTTKLLAYNIASGDVIKTIEQLGNIAAGVGKEKLPFLTLAYGQVRAMGRLTGQEVRQFTEAGVPLLELLAKQSGKTTAQIQKDVSAGAISFEMVKNAIASTSEEGGKFYNLMDKQSQTIQGRISNFADNVDQGLVRVGNRLKGTGMDFLEMAADFIEGAIGSESAINRSVSAIKAAIATYITYQLWMKRAAIQKQAMILLENYHTAAALTSAGALGTLRAATMALWATMVANPVGAVLTALSALVALYYTFETVTTDVTSAIGEEEAKLKSELDTLNAVSNAVLTANAANGDRLALLKSLNQAYPDLLRGLDLEKVSNRELANILAAVNREYKNRIEMARLAYQAELSGEKRKELYKSELDLINQLKEADANFKPVSRDIAGVLKEADAYIKRASAERSDPYLTRLIAELRNVRPEAQEVINSIQEIDKEDTSIAENKRKRTEAQDAYDKRNYEAGLRRIKQLQDELKTNKKLSEDQRKEKQQQLDAYLERKKRYEEEHGLVVVNGQKTEDKKKKWHNDELTRELAERKAMEESLQKDLLVLNTEERIAESKAIFEKKTQAEIELIHAEYEEKRQKLLEAYRKKRQSLTDAERKRISDGLDDVIEHEQHIQEQITLIAKKEQDKRTKLDLEYQLLLQERSKIRQESALEQRRAEEMSGAKTLQQRIAIERKYDNDVAAIRISSLNEQILRENFRMATLKKQGKLTAVQESETRNRILELENEIDKAKEELNKKDADRQKQAADRRRQLERETTQMIIQLLSQTENAYLRGFANILAAYQQFADKRDKDEIKWQDKVALGFTVLTAVSSAFFSAESEKYANLAQLASEKNAAEMEALQKRHEAELTGFIGNEAQKKQIQDRQAREEKALKERQQKEEAALKVKQWKADQASKISQTLISGALAGIQAYAQLGPIGGAIAAGIIGVLTTMAVAKISRQKAPKFYATGTEYVDDQREFPTGVDTVPAMLTRGESVLTVKQNERKRALGLTNDQLLSEIEMYRSGNIRHLFSLENREYGKPKNPNEKVERLLSEMGRDLKNLKKTNISIDRRGFGVFTKQKNQTIKFLNNQYFGS